MNHSNYQPPKPTTPASDNPDAGTIPVDRSIPGEVDRLNAELQTSAVAGSMDGKNIVEAMKDFEDLHVDAGNTERAQLQSEAGDDTIRGLSASQSEDLSRGKVVEFQIGAVVVSEAEQEQIARKILDDNPTDASFMAAAAGLPVEAFDDPRSVFIPSLIQIAPPDNPRGTPTMILTKEGLAVETPPAAEGSVVVLTGDLPSAVALFQMIKVGSNQHLRSMFPRGVIIFDYGIMTARTAKALQLQDEVNKTLRSEDIGVRGFELMIVPSKFEYPAPAEIVIAASFARSIGASNVVFGAYQTMDDSDILATPSFWTTFNHALAISDPRPINITVPFITNTIAEVVKIGNSLNVPFDMTWSCFVSGSKPCGHCDGCKQRAAAFNEAGVVDPILKE